MRGSIQTLWVRVALSRVDLFYYSFNASVLVICRIVYRQELLRKIFELLLKNCMLSENNDDDFLIILFSLNSSFKRNWIVEKKIFNLRGITGEFQH